MPRSTRPTRSCASRPAWWISRSCSYGATNCGCNAPICSNTTSAVFGHLLVDEFQDTNRIQYAWLRVLAGKSGKVWAVGDDDQSIYGWRGAKIENIHHFRRDFAAVGTVRLEQNYRSTGTILRAANALIGNNTERLGKNLWTDAGDGGPILVYSGYNDLDEARFVADRTHMWIRDGGTPADVAVLYRSNAQSRVIEEAFLRLDIPYRIYGGLRFFERAEVRNALAYLRLVSQRHADVAFERAVNTPPRGIGGKTVDAIRAIARASQVSMWQASKEGIAQGLFKGRAAANVGAFLKLIDEIALDVADLSLHDIAEHCIERSGLMEYHTRERGERGMARRENLEELVTACRQFGREQVFPLDVPDDGEPLVSELDEFLDQAALDSGDHQRRRPGRADDDAALRQGPGVPAGVHRRHGGGAVPEPHGLNGRTAAWRRNAGWPT